MYCSETIVNENANLIKNTAVNKGSMRLRYAIDGLGFKELGLISFASPSKAG